ncbi:DUF2470 domain-containing protein [Nocardiopsis sp. HNM0947]|uniref:DUF2470 domain-containing protein n=1 Tax=Nocardiopsis coralli TaxID=2772213 RepID=A0ABR9P758_9ACTN|nr:DUF2470 domain-containing protein [Nocardiopsis coralli]MBE2999677.1 DUF2470 domain-containing protein [Nocardiopsis coralli]
MILLLPSTNLSVPSPAERARSVLARPNPATVTSSDRSLHLTGPVCHTTPQGEVTLLVPDRHMVLAEIGAGTLEATLEFTDTAPVDLRDSTRSLLWINGTLRVPPRSEARNLALAVSDQDPDERLLDLGHGRTMVTLAPDLVVHSDHDGCHLITPAEFAGAPADPFGRWEGPWLRHLEDSHPDVLWGLVAHCPEPLPQGRPRPLGVDRHGLRLRLEGPEGDHDVRICFRRPARTPDDVAHEVQQMAGLLH